MLLDFLDDNLFMLEVLKILAYCCNDNKTRLQLLKWDSIPSICNTFIYHVQILIHVKIK